MATTSVPGQAAKRRLSRPASFFGIVFCLFLAETAAHLPLLHLPYYWDEAGYYIPAAYDFFRTGTLIPFSTLTNAHPPGLSLYLALLWHLFGFHIVVARVGMCLAAAAALTAVFALVQNLLRSRAAAWSVVLLTACYPVWFAQSSLAQADMLAAVGTLWGLYFALRTEDTRRDCLLASACFTAAALTKEIAIGTPLVLAVIEAVAWLRGAGAARRAHLRRSLWLALPVLPLAAWFAYHRWRTGFTFGNPQYLRYNAESTLVPGRIAMALLQRTIHLTMHLNLFVPVLIALGCLLLPPMASRARLRRGTVLRIWCVLVANGLLFSFLGGALLTRYLLPMFPLVLLLAFAAVYARLKVWAWFPALAAAGFIAALLLPPPYRIAPEDTLAYRQSVLVEQAALSWVAHNDPYATILTAWPYSDGLRKPELGYVRTPMAVVPVENFTLPALAQVVQQGRPFSMAIVFSTKYVPRGFALKWGPWGEREQIRYFDAHRDLSAATVAALLHGTIVFEQHRGTQWAAVLRFNHPAFARLTPHRSYNQVAELRHCAAAMRRMRFCDF